MEQWRIDTCISLYLYLFLSVHNIYINMLYIYTTDPIPLLQVASDIEMEGQRVEQWRIENVRRRHNYVPFIVNFLRILAERGELVELVDQAKKKLRAKN